MKVGWRWLFSAIGLVLALPFSIAADDSCGRPGNLTYNCNFDHFVDRSDANSTRIVPDGWIPWVTMGNPAFDRDDHGSAPGAPAQRIWSDGGAWTAGLYQQVQVTPGKAYELRLDWAPMSPPDIGIERNVGIDPLGGTDPTSTDVVWGQSTWEDVRMPDLHVSAVAQASTVTVFVWTHHPVSHGADQVFIDAVTLVEDPTLVLPTPSSTPTVPRPTRKPPTRTPSPVPPTATPTALLALPTPVETPTTAPTSTQTSTPTLTPTQTSTCTPAPPTPTPPPTRTPLPTIVPVARVVSTPEAEIAARSEPRGSGANSAGSVFLYVAVGTLICASLLVGAAVWMWLRSRGAMEKQD